MGAGRPRGRRSPGGFLHGEHLGDRGSVGVAQRGGAPVLPGKPVIGQVQVDAGGLDAEVPGPGLHRLQRNPASRSRVRHVCRS
jgi:hypothetical protein